MKVINEKVMGKRMLAITFLLKGNKTEGKGIISNWG
jgi:hypothetical protein